MDAKQFVLRVLKFSLLAIAVFLLPCVYFTVGLNQRHFYEMPEKQIIFIGDSRIETSVNDTLQSNTLNIAQSAESYLYSYIKLRKMIAINPQIKTVVLGFSDLNLHADMEDWYFKNQPLQFKVSNFLFLMPPAEIKLLLRNNFKTTIAGILDYPKFKFDVYKNMKPGDKINTLGVGRYESINPSQWKAPKPGELESKMRPDSFRYSKHQLQYLDKIFDLCKRANVELVFLSTPLHRSFQTGSRFSDSIHTARYPMVKYLDYTSMDYPDSCFGDYEHLNYQGSQQFTDTLFRALGLKR
jgi:hypothetical protein